MIVDDEGLKVIVSVGRLLRTLVKVRGLAAEVSVVRSDPSHVLFEVVMINVVRHILMLF